MRRFLGLKNSLENYKTSKNTVNELYLLNDSCKFNIFPYVPRDFSITTENGTYKFNVDLLKMKSYLIRQYLEEYPQSLQYNLKTKDESKIMEKLEQIFKGEIICIPKVEELSFDKILDLLRIAKRQTHMQSFFSSNSFDYKDLLSGQIEIKLSEEDIVSYLQNLIPKTFIIATKKNEYKCNIIGVHSSKVVNEFISKNPNSTRYDFDFHDECGEFQQICNLFNFNKVKMTQDNIDTLKYMAEELQIETIMNDIDKFIDNYENLVQKVDDQQTIIDSINELFEWLYKIKEITVQEVKDRIINSNWINTEENVQELAAFIIQVIQNDNLLHRYLADLIESLNKEADKSNKLEILVPFIVKQLLRMLGNNKFLSSFIIILYQRGMIKKDEIMLRLKSAKISDLNEAYVIFIPELVELFGDKIQFHLSYVNDLYKSSSKDNFQKFLKIREDGEPDDKLIKALRNDDIDTFQSIISTQEIDVNKSFIPYNIFDDFNNTKHMNYINYSAAYGSLKCFKYLFLNHASLDDSSFYYAIYGGNIEIIKIIDQQDLKFSKNKINLILSTIKKHQNHLFDWFFEQDFKIYMSYQLDILNAASENGNIHPVASIIDKGYDFFDLSEEQCKKIIEIASRNGFYKFLKFVFNFLREVIEKNDFKKSLIFDPELSVYFGNISILDFYYQHSDNFDINKALTNAVIYEQEKIVEYICDHYEEKLKLSQRTLHKSIHFNLINFIQTTLHKSIHLKTNKIFIYLIDKFKNYFSIEYTNIISDLRNLLSEACYSQNLEITKIIINIILEQNSDNKFDFTLPFYNAAVKGSTEICNLIIDKKCFIDFELLSLQKQELITINKDILDIIIKNMTPIGKEIFISYYLIDAIKTKNKFFIEYLLKENAKDDFSLIEAVKTQDIEIVNMILNSNSEPSFINKLSINGTALNLAVSLNQFDIVKRLLSIPGIDPNLYGLGSEIPLATSVSKLNVDSFNAILDFYGTNIKSQQFQLNQAFKKLLQILAQKNNIFNLNKEDVNPNFLIILNKLVQIESINLNIYYSNHTLLSLACLNNEIDIVKTLLKNDTVDINSFTTDSGDSPLMIAISKNNVEIAKLLIKKDQININHRNYMNETALTKSASNNLIEIVDLIINHKKFNPIESCIDYAFYLSIRNSEISKKLIEIKDIDVNYKNLNSSWKSLDKNNNSQMINFSNTNANDLLSTPLLEAVNTSNNELFDLIINHPSFDPIKSLINEAMLTLFKQNDVNSFIKLMKIVSNNIDIINKYMPTFLSYAVRNGLTDITKEILNNEKFDSKRCDIINIFISSFNKYHPSFDIMNEIIEFDKKHDNLIDFKQTLPNGKSYFTVLSDFLLCKDEFDNIVSFFIEKGVDPNAPDKNGIYPLQYAISRNLFQFVNALINSGKIDFSIKLNRKCSSGPFDFKSSTITYLHMVANDVKMLSLFLDNKLIDINVVDSNGETALMYACRSGNIDCVNKLFEFDKLNYLLCNNKGYDAIKILLNLESIQNFDIPKNREEYHQCLLKLLNNEIKGTKKIVKPIKISFGEQNENPTKISFGDENKNSMNIENKENKTDKPIKKFTLAKNFGEKNKAKNDNQTNIPSGIEIHLKHYITPPYNLNASKIEPSKDLEKNAKPSLFSFSKKQNESRGNQMNKQSDIKFDLKIFKSPPNDSSASKTEPSEVQEKDTKPSLFSFSKNEKDSSEKNYINLTNKQTNSQSNDDSLIQKEIVTSILEISEKFTQEEAQKISKMLESIVNKEVEKITSSKSIIQNSTNERNEDVKLQKKSENKTMFHDQKLLNNDKDKKDDQERKLIRTRKNILHHIIEEEIENDDDDYYNLYQTQIIQQQWNQMMQIDNMRNAQFNMILNQQSQMMKSLVNESKRNKKSLNKKSKKKKKSNK